MSDQEGLLRPKRKPGWRWGLLGVVVPIPLVVLLRGVVPSYGDRERALVGAISIVIAIGINVVCVGMHVSRCRKAWAAMLRAHRLLELGFVPWPVTVLLGSGLLASELAEAFARPRFCGPQAFFCDPYGSLFAAMVLAAVLIATGVTLLHTSYLFRRAHPRRERRTPPGGGERPTSAASGDA